VRGEPISNHFQYFPLFLSSTLYTNLLFVIEIISYSELSCWILSNKILREKYRRLGIVQPLRSHHPYPLLVRNWIPLASGTRLTPSLGASEESLHRLAQGKALLSF